MKARETMIKTEREIDKKTTRIERQIGRQL